LRRAPAPLVTPPHLVAPHTVPRDRYVAAIVGFVGILFKAFSYSNIILPELQEIEKILDGSMKLMFQGTKKKSKM